MVATYSERLAEAMKARGVETAELSRRMDVTYQAVKKALNGGRFGTENHLKACQVLSVRSEWLAAGVGPRDLPKPSEPQPEYAGKPRPARRIAVVGTAKMGEDGFYEEISSIPGAGDGHLDVTSDDPHAYVLRVRGNSMYPTIRDGWYVLVEPGGRCAAGEPVLIKLKNGRKLVKEYLYERADSVEVSSVNGGERLTVQRPDLESMQPVAGIFPPSKWKPD